MTNWSFGFRCLLIWGGGSCVGPSHIRTLVTLRNRHATDAEKSKLSCLWTKQTNTNIWSFHSFTPSSLHRLRQRMVTTQTITPGRGSVNGRWSRSRAWSWRLCLVLVTRASKTWATLVTSAQWYRSSSASQTFRGCEYTDKTTLHHLFYIIHIS